MELTASSGMHHTNIKKNSSGIPLPVT